MSNKRWLWGSLLVAGILFAFLAAGACVERKVATPQSAAVAEALPKDVPEEFRDLFEVYAILKSEHLDRDHLDRAKLSRGAIDGMLKALGDPYAAYLDKEQFGMESDRFKGFFEGIGAEVSLRDNQITIVAPIADTPAEKAGIRPGDVILAVNGESTEGMSLPQVIGKIRGPKGTPVEIKILHRGQSNPVTLTIVRSVINVASVKLRVLTGDVAHLRVTTFGERTADELAKELERLERTKAKGIILDMRNNPGGLLTSVVDVASQFLKDGLVLYEVDGKGQRTDWRVRPSGKARDIPMVVLVNEFSASGSEVVAGALRDYQRATLIGAKTFGKGSVNTQRTLKDGSGLYFTIARWYTPNGTLIEGKGIEPDILVPQTPEDKEDIQLDKAIEVLGSLLSKGR